MRPTDPNATSDDLLFGEAVGALNAGDFSRIQALFKDRGSLGQSRSQIEEWYDAGRFDQEPTALAQALTCACMLGQTRVAAFLLDRGVDPVSGAESGQTGFHYAASGGHLDTVDLLIERHAPLEVKNRFGGTVLDQALWSAVNEPKRDHALIIERLIKAGASLEAVGGRGVVDEVLRQHAERFRTNE
ncbi:MAG: ankyrin repeat domain-containing protein [Acidobacteriota bacterium]